MKAMYLPENYHNTIETIPDEEALGGLTERIYTQVFRTDFTAPGFALVRFRQEIKSIVLRRFMITLKEALDAMYWQDWRRHLNSLSMMQFDQQGTTKFHLDGAPAESYLMLGYEPSNVQSELHMADYTHAAHDLNLTPEQFLVDYNPMYTRGEQKLASYTTRLEEFDNRFFHLLLINNSCLPFHSEGSNSLGVMHQATILTPDPTQSRIVNSIMLAVSEVGGRKVVDYVKQQDFLAA